MPAHSMLDLEDVGDFSSCGHELEFHELTPGAKLSMCNTHDREEHREVIGAERPRQECARINPQHISHYGEDGQNPAYSQKGWATVHVWLHGVVGAPSWKTEEQCRTEIAGGRNI